MARTTATYGVARPLRGRVHALQPSRHLRDGVQRHDLFQARVIPRPMRLGPHLSLSQTTKITVGSDRDQPNRPTQTGSKWQVYREPVEIVPPRSAGNVELRHGNPHYHHTGSSGRLSELQIQGLPPIGRAPRY